MRGQVSALPASGSPAIGASLGEAVGGSRRLMAACSRVVRRTAVAVLEPVESVLLNASARERIHASATFSLIILFAVTSLDFLIAGGPEFGAPARAAQPARHIVWADAPAPAGVSDARAEDVPTALAAPMAETRAARIVAVSQNFESPFAALDEMGGEIEVIDQSAGSSELLALTGAPAPSVETQAAPGKDTPAKGPPRSVARAAESAPL